MKTVFTIIAQHYCEWETLEEDKRGFALSTEVHDPSYKTTLVVATRFQLRAAHSAAKQYHDKHRTLADGDGTPDQTGPIAGIRIWKTEVGGKPGKSELVDTPYDYYF